jgi:hypothetical protein
MRDTDGGRRGRKTLRWLFAMALICGGLIGILFASMVSDCSFAGGRCGPDDPAWDSDTFVAGTCAAAAVATGVLTAARAWRWRAVAVAAGCAVFAGFAIMAV